MSLTKTNGVSLALNQPDEIDAELDIDPQSQLPISRLPYDETPIAKSDLSWLKNGRTLQFSLDRSHDSGVLFLSSDQESKMDVQNDRERKLYPFDIPSNMDTSEEYVQFLTTIYHTFEPLLTNQAYKHFSEDDEESNFGVLSQIQENIKEKKQTLQSIMSIVINSLKDLISTKSINDPNFQETFIFNYEEILNVLNLLNAVYFSNEEERIALLSVWINRADIQPDDGLAEEVLSFENPYRNLLFWSSYVKKLLLRGLFKESLDALDQSNWKNLKTEDLNLFNIITDFKKLLETYDMLRFSADAKEFLIWKQSMVQLRERAASTSFVEAGIAAEIQELLNITSASSSAILDAADTWYEALFAHYLYQLPSLELLDEYMQVSIDRHPPETVQSWETMCIELLQGKMLSVITSIEMLDKSIATFTSVLMVSAGLLKGYLSVISFTEATLSATIDQMLEDLAFSYLTHRELFPIGIGILIMVNNSNSREVVSELLPRYQITNNDDFEWCLSICAKLKLRQTAVKIYLIQGSKLAAIGYLYEALYCYTEAGDYVKLTQLVWSIFEKLLVGDLQDSTLTAKIRSNEILEPALRQAVSPLAVLDQFLQQKDTVKFKPLFQLFDFTYLPKHYKMGLIMLLEPYLGKRLLSVDELVEFIRVLNQFEKELTPEVLRQGQELCSKKTPGYDFQNRLLAIRQKIGYEMSLNFL
ncbi:hypothetical protein OGAPHI_002801 [Ogataea philodendri]|uniref:Nuclear pore complex protein Nup85 n=1 Tax=Ogataea philodendri TaxID=1378263 RepID=A0A9P8P9A0_9ASCO|nr:uncharacterized protein OGAPHI_002801 [Ogataea philodendri]KAH3667152.1 hypothetical protein OGAPHI_002801 [Ogataea philodendri]